MLAYQPISQTSSGYTIAKGKKLFSYTHQELSNDAKLRIELIKKGMNLKDELREAWFYERKNHRDGVSKTPEVNIVRNENREEYNVYTKIAGTPYLAASVSDHSIRSNDGLGLHLLDLIFSICLSYQELLEEKTRLS